MTVADAAAAPDAAPGRLAIGVDVGGSGIKAAVVDVDAGRFRRERLRVATPKPATPEAVIASIGRLVKRLAKASGLGTTTPVGVGLPGVAMDEHADDRRQHRRRLGRLPGRRTDAQGDRHARSGSSTTPTRRASPRCASASAATRPASSSS